MSEPDKGWHSTCKYPANCLADTVLLDVLCLDNNKFPARYLMTAVYDQDRLVVTTIHPEQEALLPPSKPAHRMDNPEAVA